MYLGPERRCGSFSKNTCNQSTRPSVFKSKGPDSARVRFSNMTKKSVSHTERLNRAGRRLVIAASVSGEDAANIASSPFLLARVRARIVSETEANEARGVWANFWLISRKAIPAMALAAAFSFGLFLYTGNKTSNAAFSVDAYLGASDSGIDSLVFAERRPLTAEEVFETIVTKDEREAGR